MCVETFEEHADTGLCALKYQLLDHIAEDVQRLGMPSVMDSRTYQHYNKHIKQS